MAFFYEATEFHAGEKQMQTAMKVPPRDNPTVPALSPQLAAHFQIAPLIAVGTLDKQGRPWTTLWGGEAGLARSLGDGIAGIRSAIGAKYDPVAEELFGKEADGSVVREDGVGRMISGLTIDLEKRKRVKFFGRMIAGALNAREDEVMGEMQSHVEVQLVLKIEQSLGNCPKYLNAKRVRPCFSRPKSQAETLPLNTEAAALIQKADLFFMSSCGPDGDMDTNHRGGPAGFVRIMQNEESGLSIVYPEYSGNRLYQTLGNLSVDSRIGLCFPDLKTGDMLYLTGSATVLVGKEAAAVLPKSNLAVRVDCTAARFVRGLLPFRADLLEDSPYNPKIRYLPTERAVVLPDHDVKDSAMTATLLSQEPLSSTISRFRFRTNQHGNHGSGKPLYSPGQYVTFDFSEHLDIGYSHMRDDDPLSINDDFVRTFTVSSNPKTLERDDEFEITIRKVGPVTKFLFQQQSSNHLQFAVQGFGGEFRVTQEHSDESIAFIAAGIGITPLLSRLPDLDPKRLTVLWSIRQDDIPFVEGVIKQQPELASSLTVFLSRPVALEETTSTQAEDMELKSVRVETRRICEEDVKFEPDVKRIYLCTGTAMRQNVLQWLGDKEVVYEDFNF